MKIEKRDILEDFSMYYSNSKNKFYCIIKVNNGEFTITGQTAYHDTPEEALSEAKEKLTKAYLKVDTEIETN